MVTPLDAEDGFFSTVKKGCIPQAAQPGFQQAPDDYSVMESHAEHVSGMAFAAAQAATDTGAPRSG